METLIYYIVHAQHASMQLHYINLKGEFCDSWIMFQWYQLVDVYTQKA